MNTNPGAWMVIYCKQKKTFLLGKRGPNMNKPNLWNLFGGHLNTGETFAEGVLRELDEEAGISPGEAYGILLGTQKFLPLGHVCGIREMRYFLMVTDVEIAPTLDDEHRAFGWYRYDALPHQVNRPTAIAMNIGLFVKAMTLVDQGLQGDCMSGFPSELNRG